MVVWPSQKMVLSHKCYKFVLFCVFFKENKPSNPKVTVSSRIYNIQNIFTASSTYLVIVLKDPKKIIFFAHTEELTQRGIPPFLLCLFLMQEMQESSINFTSLHPINNQFYFRSIPFLSWCMWSCNAIHHNAL